MSDLSMRQHRPGTIPGVLLFCLFLFFFLLSAGCGKRDQAEGISVSQAFDLYTEQLFLQQVQEDTLSMHYTLAHPENLGITEYTVSLGHILTPQEDFSAAQAENVLYSLEHFPKEELTRSQKLDRDVLADSMETLISKDAFPYYEEILSPGGGIQTELPILLAEYPFYDARDVKDYLALLGQIPDYLQEAAEYENGKSRAGLFMPDFASDSIISQLEALTADKENHFLIRTFQNRIEKLDMSEELKSSYKEQNRQLVENTVLPAFQELASALLELQGTGVNEEGLCGYKQGKSYYSWLVRRSTGSSMDVPQLKKAIREKRARDLTALQALLKGNPGLKEDCQNAALSFTTPEEMLICLKKTSEKDFPLLESHTEVNVKETEPSMSPWLAPAFYLTVPLDEEKDNSVYINDISKTDPMALFTTLAHEGYPGHLYQTVSFNHSESCLLRHLLYYPGYVEGWATYGEMFAFSYGGLDLDTAACLQLERSILLSLYAEADIGIHYENWSLADLEDFFSGYGIGDSQTMEEIYRYIVMTPANYLKYYCGYLEFAMLKEEAEKKYGDTFRITAFHQAILEIGPAPFWIIREYLPDYYRQAAGHPAKAAGK